jgi:hypothetical protein
MAAGHRSAYARDVELLHGPDGRALAHATRRLTERLLWWGLVAVGVVGLLVFAALVGLLLWGIFTGVPGVTSR